MGAFPQLLLMAKYHHIEPIGDLHHAIWKKAGPVWGLSASAIDVLKGIGTVWLARSLDFDISVVTLSALAATCGQMWPVFKKFDGEKGNTTGFGAAATLAFWPAIICLIPVFLAIISKVIKAAGLKSVPKEQRFRTGAGQSNALPLGVGAAFLVLPLAAYLLDEPMAVVAGFAALFVLVMVRRLTAGLSADLATDSPRDRIFWSRLLLDRPVVAES
ncbi:glycerol-3-phosphate acyltransferase [Dehalogenimonas etheniformans]|nr:glycerol-3-phosphate acyltransferase [Dehalogenimonas etheniformans]